MNRITLSVLGLSSSQSQSGAYALILQEENGRARIPIIIGPFEAQSIAIAMEGLAPPRPLTHDLFLNVSQAFNFHLVEIEINKIEEGIFYSQLVFKSNTKTVVMDARTSDAVALAVRYKAPIFATIEVLNKAGITMEDEMQEDNDKTSQKGQSTYSKKKSPQSKIKQLQKQLQKAIEQENYEEASRIKIEIAKLDASKE